jgi:hypothetical protein
VQFTILDALICRNTQIPPAGGSRSGNLGNYSNKFSP